MALSADSITSLYVGLSYLQYVAADTDRAMLEYESLQGPGERPASITSMTTRPRSTSRRTTLDAAKAKLDDLAAEQAELADEVAADLAT